MVTGAWGINAGGVISGTRGGVTAPVDAVPPPAVVSSGGVMSPPPPPPGPPAVPVPDSWGRYSWPEAGWVPPAAALARWLRIHAYARNATSPPPTAIATAL